MTTSKAILGILAGIAAGAVIGVILAPKKDRRTKNISRESEDLANAINDKIDEKFEALLQNISGKVKKAKVSEGAESNREA